MTLGRGSGVMRCSVLVWQRTAAFSILHSASSVETDLLVLLRLSQETTLEVSSDLSVTRVICSMCE